MERKDIKFAAKLFLYISIAIVFCMAFYGAFESIKIALFTDEIGVNIYSNDEEGNVIQDSYYYSEDETADDVVLEEGERLGEALNTETPRTIDIAFGVFEQLFLLVIFYLSVDLCLREHFRKHKYAHTLAGKDFDKYKGIKIGLLASIPSFIIYLLLIIGKIARIDSLVIIFKSLNWHMAPLIRLFNMGILSSAEDLSWLSVLLNVLCWAVIPISAHVAFILGVGDGKYYNKIVYKENQGE